MVTLSNVTQAFQPNYNKNHNILGELHIECGLLRKWRQYQTAQLRCSIDQSVRIDWDLNTALLTNNILKGTTCYQTKDQKTSKKWKTPGFLFWNKLKRLGFGVEASRTKNSDQSGTRKDTFILPDLLHPCPRPPLRQTITFFFLISSQHQLNALTVDRHLL